MRIISLSVDGIQSATDKGLFEWLAGQDAEAICLQDLRMGEYDVLDNPAMQLDGYFSYVLDAPDPSVNGVAIYTRQMPKAIVFGFGMPTGEDTFGRYLQADFDQYSIGSLLAPKAEAGTQSQADKLKFFDTLQAHLTKVTRKRRRYIICGGWGMAHKDIDVQNAAAHESESGFLPEERQWLNQLYNDIGYADAFRLGNTDPDEFSWWPSGTPGEGDGWRTDTHIISQEIVPRVEYAVMYKAQQFSSHCPVLVDYDLEDL